VRQSSRMGLCISFCTPFSMGERNDGSDDQDRAPVYYKIPNLEDFRIVPDSFRIVQWTPSVSTRAYFIPACLSFTVI
jgi:hypothetical protein